MAQQQEQQTQEQPQQQPASQPSTAATNAPAPKGQCGFHLCHPYEAYWDEPIEDKTQRTPNWAIHAVLYTLRPLAYALFRMRVRGKENIPKMGEGPVVFVANHVSYVDPIVMWVSAPPRAIRFLARSSLWRVPLLRGLISRVGAIPVDPESADRKALKRAAASLKRGECVGIFAEGTRMRKHDKPYNAHGGFVLVAQMGKAKIVPVGITGADRIAGPDRKIKIPRLPKITVTYGKAFSLSEFADVPKTQRTQAIVDETMRRVFALRDAADAAPIRPGLPPYGIVSERDKAALLGERPGADAADAAPAENVAASSAPAASKE